ncbi:MAG: hypothetical protein ACI9U2_002348 [Bradymonadia bacterium]|jgi:hypothetical protein
MSSFKNGNHKTIQRRTFLRGMIGGAVASVALPTLECMLGVNGEAWADGAPLPTRFGVWFWGNGVRRSQWLPAGTGANWQANTEMAPLNPVKAWISPVTGLEIKTASHPHHSGMTGILTGKRYHQVGITRDTIVTTFDGPSVDQIAAAHFEGTTPLRSLEVAVCRFRGTDEGTTFQHLSHNGPNNVNPSEYAPANLFRRLFGMGPTDEQLESARRSVLDAVNGRIRSLQAKVGVRDRQRLEQHFDSIRALELRLAADARVCARPDEPGVYPDIEGREQIAEKNQSMSRLVALALACDMTRAFSVMFSTAGSGVIVWPAGAQNSLHQMCHDEAGDQPTVHAAVTYQMERLSEFLQILRDTPDGAGNLLDNSSILCTTELSEGNRHSNDEFPVLIAGKGGGRLRGGIHYRSNTRENASMAGLTALRGAGVPMESFGEGLGRTVNAIGALQV